MKKQNRIMKELKSEATHLIKQGDKLYWKNPYVYPYRSLYSHDTRIKRRDFERYSEANPIYAIGDWPDKEEFSREEVVIIKQYWLVLQQEWLDMDISSLEGIERDVRLAARYNGEHRADIKWVPQPALGEEPSPVEQFRAEIVRMLEERTSELKRDKYIDTRDKAIRIKEIRLIMTMVKSVK